jgi:hypothetical protein
VDRERPTVALLLVTGCLLAGCLLAGCLLAGCRAAAASPSPPAGSTSPRPSATAASSATPAPALDPCDLLRPAQAAEFVGRAVGPAQLSDRGDGTACVYAATAGGMGTIGITVSAARASRGTLPDLAHAAPDAHLAPGLDQVLVASGSAWLVLDGRLVSVVLVHGDGRLATPVEMGDVVKAILVSSPRA